MLFCIAIMIGKRCVKEDFNFRHYNRVMNYALKNIVLNPATILYLGIIMRDAKNSIKNNIKCLHGNVEMAVAAKTIIQILIMRRKQNDITIYDDDDDDDDDNDDDDDEHMEIEHHYNETE